MIHIIESIGIFSFIRVQSVVYLFPTFFSRDFERNSFGMSRGFNSKEREVVR
jgi:hypothetical protein